MSSKHYDEAMAQRQQNLRHRRKEEGRCACCDRAAMTGMTRCAYHWEMQKIYIARSEAKKNGSPMPPLPTEEERLDLEKRFGEKGNSKDTRDGRHWIKDDDTMLCKMLDEEQPISDIMAELSRSETAIIRRAKTLGRNEFDKNNFTSKYFYDRMRKW